VCLQRQRIWQKKKMDQASFIGGKNIDVIITVVFEGMTSVTVAKC
jgi:hypothetical protein